MLSLFNSVLAEEITLNAYLVCLISAFVCGLIVAIASAVKAHATKSFIVSLILLPMIVCTVIIMVNGNIGTGVAVMGAFSLVRFRSVPGKAKDIVSIFLAMTSGLACAAGFVYIALVFTAIVSAVLLALQFIPLGGEREMDLLITIPESLRFADEFNDIFKEFTVSSRLVKTKTTNMGSLYKLFYKVRFKDRAKIQEFIDKLRCRNGNLEISVAESAEGVDEL